MTDPHRLAPQLAALQLELAMALGSSLELAEVLDEVLDILLRRLDGRAAAVFGVPRGGEGPALLGALPHSAAASLREAGLAAAGALAHHGVPWLETTLEADGWRYAFALPELGVLVLERRGTALLPMVLRALGPLMQRLGRAGRACADHAALRASEARFGALVAALPEVMLEGTLGPGPEVVLDYVSPRARAVLGIGAEALRARPGRLARRLSPAERTPLLATLERAARTHTPFEHLLHLDPGTPEARWLLLAGRPKAAAVGEPAPGRHWSGFIQDVTDRERLAASERESARLRMSALLGAVGDAIVGSDAAGRITHWNLAAEHLLGFKATEAIGQYLELFIPPRLRAAHAEGMRRLEATGLSRLIGRPIELPALHARGHELPIELVLARVEAEGAAFYLGVMRDLTERHRAAAEQARAMEEERRFAAALLEIGRAALDDAQSFARAVTVRVAATLGVEWVSLWSREPDGLCCVDRYSGPLDQHAGGQRIEASACADYLAALDDDAPLVAPDARHHPATRALGTPLLEPLGITSSLHFPLRSLDGTCGVLAVDATAPRAWRASELRFGAEVASLVSQGNARAVRRQLEARHAVVLAAIGDGVIACDRAERVTLLNPVAERLTGWRREEAIGRPLDEVFRLRSADGATPVATLIAEALAVGEDQRRSQAVVLRARDGARHLIADRAAPIVENDQHIGAVLTFRDVADEEAARRALEAQNQRLRSLGEAIPDRVFTLALDGRLTSSQGQSAQEESHHGDGPDATMTVQERFSAEVASALLAAGARAATHGAVEVVEYRLDAADGAHWFEARLARMSAEEVTVIVREVTLERARTEALERQQERLEAVLSSTSAILYAARLPDFSIEYISESASEVLGFPPAAFLGTGFWVDALHPDDRARVLAGLEALTATGRHTHEYRHRHGGGGYRWLRDEVRLIYGSEGDPIRAVGASFDITDRKLSEHRLATLLKVQQIISRASAAFLETRPAGSPEAVDAALAELGALAGAERAYVFLIEDNLADNTHEWCAKGVAPMRHMLQRLPAEHFSFFLEPISRGHPLAIEAVSKLPPEAQAEQEILQAQGIERLIAVPLIRDGAIRGFLGIDNPNPEPLVFGEFAGLMRLLADTISAGLQRVLDEGALQRLNEALRHKTEQQNALLELSTQLARARSRAELLETLSHALHALLDSDRVSLIERISDDRFLIRLLHERAGRPAAAGGHVNREILEREVSRTALRNHAPLLAMDLGVPVTTQQRSHADFPDWAHLHAQFGYRQFVVVPLFSTEGVRGTLNVCHDRDQPPTPSEIDWIAQCGAVLAAHLSIHETREALLRLNLALESRVAARTRELQASEARFEQLFKQAPQAMLIFDLEGRVVQSNRNAQRLFGASEARLLGASLDALVPTDSPGERDRFREDLVAERPEGVAVPDRILSATRLDGGAFSASVGVVPIDLNGRRHILAGVSDVTARLQAEAAVARSLGEKETLLKEIHHRVKNNLQIISSLLMLQAEHLPEGSARGLIEESVLRVRSMALIHQQLYGVESLARLDFGAYARALAGSLCAILAPTARLSVETQESWITVETAVPLGLILNELLTNALKYGVLAPSLARRAEPGRTGSACDVCVEIGPVPEGLRVAVIDSGPGLPEGFDPTRSTGLGMQLVRSLGRQLRGHLSFDVDRGSRFVVVCPVPAQG